MADNIPDNENAVISRRAALLGAGGLSVFGILASRLYYLQVTEAARYQAQSENNRFNFNTIIPERGRIFDRTGQPVATNRQDFRVVLIPERVTDIDLTLDKLGSIIPLAQTTRARIKRDIKVNAKFVPILVDEHLDWASFSKINLQIPDLPGILPLEGKGRAYPHKGLFAHVLGYVGKPNAQALAADTDPLLRQPTFRIGKSGIEQSMDKALRGSAGRQKVEVNAFGRTVKVWEEDRIDAKSGADIWLTLDAQLQAFTASAFGNESGGAVVIDTMTGELRSLVSAPTFDANLFVSGLSQTKFDELNADPKRPQFNKVIGGAYPPASTFKMAAMLAALEAKIVSPREKITCKGKTALGDRDFRCWRPRGHGAMNMRDALKQSCDVYFYEIIQKLGMRKVRAMAQKLGLGATYDIGIAGQVAGALPDAAWKKRQLNANWRTGDALNAVIGQGYVLSSPLQLAVMSARLANGRSAITPHLVVGAELPPPAPLDINPGHMDFVRDAMFSVCEERGGTAYKPGALGIDSVKMAGKTGTGQVRAISAAEHLSGVVRNEDLPWDQRDHSIFVGFAPYKAPRFAASVLVEHGGSGAGIAARICRDILGKALKLDGMGNTAELGGAAP